MLPLSAAYHWPYGTSYSGHSPTGARRAGPRRGPALAARLQPSTWVTKCTCSSPLAPPGASPPATSERTLAAHTGGTRARARRRGVDALDQREGATCEDSSQMIGGNMGSTGSESSVIGLDTCAWAPSTTTGGRGSIKAGLGEGGRSDHRRLPSRCPRPRPTQRVCRTPPPRGQRGIGMATRGSRDPESFSVPT